MILSYLFIWCSCQTIVIGIEYWNENGSRLITMHIKGHVANSISLEFVRVVFVSCMCTM